VKCRAKVSSSNSIWLFENTNGMDITGRESLAACGAVHWTLYM